MASSSAHPIGVVPPSTTRRRSPDPAPPSGAADGELSALLALVDRRRLARTGDSLRGRLGTAAPAADGATAETQGGAPAPAPAATPATGVDDRSTMTGPPARLIELERVGTAVGILRIGKPVGLSFTAGQYIRLGLTGVRQAKLTIASAPHDPYLEVCVEGIPGGRLTPRLLALGPGAVLDVDDRAKGSFVLDRSGAVHLMVATGTGIAPFRSMIRDALHRGLSDSFLVLHGASYAGHLPYRDELTALAAGDARVRYIPTVSRPDDPRNRSWTGATGRVDALAVKMLPTVAGPSTRAYACGNGGMVDAVTAALEGGGLKVHSETFD